jgi:hypothetical protein
MMDKISNKLIVFEDKKIRRAWFKGTWYFSIVDIVGILTGSVNPTDYLKKIRKRDAELGSYIGTNCPQVEMLTETGMNRVTLAGNVKDVFRIIQSIPSPKAEPFKQWLAQVGYDRIEEIENPELAQDRAKEYYELKGYPKDWIDKRIRGIAIRQELTDEWKKRGVQEQKDYAILTNEISKATFGVPIKVHKEIKGLDPKFKNQNLRDHMTDLELIFSMLGERLSTEATRKKEAHGFQENFVAAREGGSVAGRAREDAEKTFGMKVVSQNNYLEITKEKKRIEKR